MSKMKLFVVLSFAIICGCTGQSDKTVGDADGNWSKVEWNGHQYIRWSGSTVHQGSVCHDPDCPCLKKTTTKQGL